MIYFFSSTNKKDKVEHPILISTCQQELGFIDICEDINNNNYYKTIKQ